MIQKPALMAQAVAIGCAIAFVVLGEHIGAIACLAVALACGAHQRIANYERTGRPRA